MMIEGALKYATNPKTKLLAKYGEGPCIRKIKRMIHPNSSVGIGQINHPSFKRTLPDLNHDSGTIPHKRPYNCDRGRGFSHHQFSTKAQGEEEAPTIITTTNALVLLVLPHSIIRNTETWGYAFHHMNLIAQRSLAFTMSNSKTVMMAQVEALLRPLFHLMYSAETSGGIKKFHSMLWYVHLLLPSLPLQDRLYLMCWEETL